jgi:hypothetical protein
VQAALDAQVGEPVLAVLFREEGGSWMVSLRLIAVVLGGVADGWNSNTRVPLTPNIPAPSHSFDICPNVRACAREREGGRVDSRQLLQP